MKRILCLGILVLCSMSVVQAQYAGQRFLSGSAAINFDSFDNAPDNNSSNRYGYDFDLSFGKFKTDTRASGWRLSSNLAGGKADRVLIVNGVPTTEEVKGVDRIGFGVGHFWQFYKHFNEHVGIFGGPSADLNFSNAKTYDGSSDLIETKANTFGVSLGLTAGAYYKLSEKWWLTASVGFANPVSVGYTFKNNEVIRTSQKTKESVLSYQISPSITFPSVGLGVRYFYNR
jgi:hypothetical protein